MKDWILCEQRMPPIDTVVLAWSMSWEKPTKAKWMGFYWRLVDTGMAMNKLRFSCWSDDLSEEV